MEAVRWKKNPASQTWSPSCPSCVHRGCSWSCVLWGKRRWPDLAHESLLHAWFLPFFLAHSQEHQDGKCLRLNFLLFIDLACSSFFLSFQTSMHFANYFSGSHHFPLASMLPPLGRNVVVWWTVGQTTARHQEMSSHLRDGPTLPTFI